MTSIVSATYALDPHLPASRQRARHAWERLRHDIIAEGGADPGPWHQLDVAWQRALERQAGGAL